MHPVLVLHGGAGAGRLSASRRAAYAASLQSILDEIYPRLLSGDSAIAVARRTASLLEDDPLYNAGKGSKIQRDGRIRMSAAIMDGDRRRFAGCINVQGVRNPIQLAHRLLREKDRVLSDQGATRFARMHGLPFRSAYTPHQRLSYLQQKQGKMGTIGALVLDRHGRLAAATSTGGRGYEFPYRVSDSATVAANFANRQAAVSATGHGEQIVEFAVAARICAWVEAGMSFRQASNRMLKEAIKNRTRFGWIALSAKGQFFAGTTTSNLIWAAADQRGYQIMSRWVRR